MEPDYKWIAQDKDGVIAKFVGCHIIIGNHWRKGIYGEYKRITVGKHNPNWKESVIDLEKEDFEIVDGILERKPRAEVLKSELTDTELIDAIMWHKLIVDRMDNEKVIICKAGYEGINVTNKKGDIRKAIKKWLRKNT